MRFGLVIFDLDGTLVDTLGDIADALNSTLSDLGLPRVSERAVAGMVGEGVVRLLEKAGATADAHPIFRARYTEHVCRRTRPYPGIPGLLASLPQKKAVATNKPGFLARRILAELDLGRHFASVLGDEDVERKPSPRMVERLMDECGVGPDQTILVGDGVVDARTARAAGIAFCAVTWGYVPRGTLVAEGPSFLVDSAEALGEVLRRQPTRR